jgi:hypothetical protein
MILSQASLNYLLIHIMFFSPSVGEVGGLSLAASFPCISGLFFLAEDLVRGVVGLYTTVVSGF